MPVDVVLLGSDTKRCPSATVIFTAIVYVEGVRESPLFGRVIFSCVSLCYYFQHSKIWAHNVSSHFYTPLSSFHLLFASEMFVRLG